MSGSVLGLFLWLVNDVEKIGKFFCNAEGLRLGFLRMHFLHASFVLFAVSSGLLFGISAFGRKGEPDRLAVLRAQMRAAPGTTRRENVIYGIAAAAVTGLLVGMYFWF